MAVPSSGSLSILGIRRELGTNNYSSSTNYSNISIENAETGNYGTINTNSQYKPDGIEPRSWSEWYGYDHDASSPPTYLTVTFFYGSNKTNACTTPTLVVVYTQYFIVASNSSKEVIEKGLNIYSNTSLTSLASNGFYRPQSLNIVREWNGFWATSTDTCNNSYNSYLYEGTFYRYRDNSGTIQWNSNERILTFRTENDTTRSGVGDIKLLINHPSGDFATVYGIQNRWDDRDDKHRPVIFAYEEYGGWFSGLFSSDSGNFKQVYSAFTDENMSTPSGETIKSIAFSDICFVDENTTNPNNIFWVDIYPKGTSLGGVEEFHFGTMSLNSQTKSSVLYPQLFNHQNYTKKFNNLNTGYDAVSFHHYAAKPCVTSFYFNPPEESQPGSPPASGITYVYIAGQASVDSDEIGVTKNAQSTKFPFILLQSYNSQTLASSSSTNIFSSPVLYMWNINTTTANNIDYFTGFRDIKPITGGTYDYIGAITCSNYGSSSPASYEGAALLMYTYGGYAKHFKFRMAFNETIPQATIGDGSGNMYIAGISRGTSTNENEQLAFLMKTNGSSLTWFRILRLNLFSNSTGYGGWNHIAYGGGKIFVCNQVIVQSGDISTTSSVVNRPLLYDPGAKYVNGFKITFARYSSSGTLEAIIYVNVPDTTTNGGRAHKRKLITDLKYSVDQGDSNGYLYASSHENIGYAGADHITRLFKIKASNFAISNLPSGWSSSSLVNRSTAPGYETISLTATFNSYTNGSGNLKTFPNSDYEIIDSQIGDDYSHKDDRWAGGG